MAVSSSVVRVSEVTKTFRLGKIEVQALKGVDLEIATGKYISIMGPSGSGKSTLFNMIGGLDKPTSGKVFIDEVDIAQLDAYELAWLRCRKIGYIFQTFNIIQVMTALENVTLPMIFAGVPNGTLVPLDLSKVYLHNAQYTGTSGSALADQAMFSVKERGKDSVCALSYDTTEDGEQLEKIISYDCQK